MWTSSSPPRCNATSGPAINDRLGHPAGDQLLTVVAERLREAAGEALVARLGGDEFALVLPSATAADYIQRVVATMAPPVTVAGELLHVQVSIGLATADSDMVDPAELVRRADVAMYQAKHTGRNRWVTYTPAMDADATERARIERAIRQGLHHNRLHLLYQPVVALPEGRLTGVEALVRLHDADGTVIGPDRFIPVAEATGLIIPLGRWVLQTACRQAADWRRRLGAEAPARININVSARQLDDPNLLTDVAQALADTGLPAESLIVEITETAALSSDAAATTLYRLRDMGVGIALDDFGTGYSSLSLLMTCPVDVLKVDKSFVDDIDHRPDRAAVVKFLGHSATDLGVRLVAEGVETLTQATLLHQMGYQHAQGYHFAKPLPAEQIENFIQRATSPPVMAA
ncbi:putative bifunctional diguanylate cyclase/phosphodiesterase [Actinoplanes xinjiangensis]|uniref:putative bifunctional diguanylate cyclase/phosphodiesterase n=1 Tax=Actinoplanes xinjiangensis TaxID=512350 RepID=UPI003438F4CE